MARSFSFTAEIFIIGVNPFVFIPEKILAALFKQAGKDKGPVPVKGTIDGHAFIQTLVKFRGHWRLYLNTPMRKAADKDVGDQAKFTLEPDPTERITPLHPELKKSLRANPEAKKIFDDLRPSLQQEICRYINNLKTPGSIERNVSRAILFLLGKQRWIGRDGL